MRKFIRVLSVILVIIVCLSPATACTGLRSNPERDVDMEKSNGDVAVTTVVQAETVASTTTPETETAEPTVTPESEKAISVEEQILLDKDGIKITLKSLSVDGLFGPSLNVLIENDSKTNVTVQTRNSIVNGAMIDTMFSCDVVAGKKANDEITFSSTDLKLAGIKVFKDIEFSFHVFRMDNFDTIFDSDPISVRTTADPGFVQTYDDSGFMALDKDNIKVVIKKLNSTDSIWGAELFVYVENNGDKDVTIQVKDVSLNGFMVDPIFSCDVLARKKSFDSITFLESNLKDNNITKFESLELSFHVFTMQGWDTIFDSDAIKVVFDN